MLEASKMKLLFNCFIIACVSIFLMGATKWGKRYPEKTPAFDFYFKTFYTWGKSYDEVIHKNGYPDEVKEEPVYNKRYNRLDKKLKLDYANVAIQFYVYDYDNGTQNITRKLLQETNLIGCGEEYTFRDVTCNGIDVLIDKLGEPSSIQRGSYTYMIDIADMGSSPMTFTVEEGQITNIKWRYFID